MKTNIFLCLLAFMFIQYNLTAQCGTTVNTGVCYTNGSLQMLAVDICPDSPSDVVTISFTAGSIESCCDEIVVYEGATGTGTTGTEIYNQTRGATNLAGLTITGQTAGECLHIYINADGSVDCNSQGGVPASFDVTCAPPPPPPPSGGETCAASTPLCAGDATVFDGTGGVTDVADAEPDIDLGCLGSGPRPSWFYIQISAAGSIDLALNPEPLGSVDYDFALYGPFADVATATSSCGAALGTPLDCSFAGGTAPETPSIASAALGEVYVILVSKFGAASANFILSQTGGTGATDCNIVNPVVCPVEADFVPPTEGCSGSTINWAAGANCNVNGPAGSGIVVDMFTYDADDDSVPDVGGAPVGYETTIDVSSPTHTSGTGPAGTTITDKNPELSLVGFDFTCTNLPSINLPTNNTCAPITVTYFLAVFDYTNDTDGEGSFEYSPDCEVMRYDVTVYPAPLSIVIVDDGSACGTPSVELRDAAGNVCSTQSGIGDSTTATGTCSTNGDVLNWDFSNDPIITALSGAPAACAAPAMLSGTITCANCGAPCNADNGTLSISSN